MCNLKWEFLGKHVYFFFFVVMPYSWQLHFHSLCCYFGYFQQFKNTLTFCNFSLGSNLGCKTWPYEKIYCNKYLKKTQIMNFNLISDSAAFPWSKSAQPGGWSVFMGSFAKEILCDYHFYKETIVFQHHL